MKFRSSIQACADAHGNSSRRLIRERTCTLTCTLILALVVPGLIACAPALYAQAPEPDNEFKSLSQHAEAARENNDIPGAIALYRQAVRLNAAWADGWWFLGFLEYGANDYASAREALTQYIDLMPSAGPALALRGLCEFQLDDYKQSLVDIERGLALGAANQPRNEQLLHLHEALLLTQSGQFERALHTWLLLANEGVRTPVVTLGVGFAGLRIAALPNGVSASRQKIAVAAGEAALQFVAKDSRTSNLRETASVEHTPDHPADDLAGSSPNANPNAGFRALFERYPTALNAHYFYGYLLFASDPDAAVAQFRQELQLMPRNAVALAMLAWASLMRSDAPAALPYATQAVAVDPDLPLAQLVMGRALLETRAINPAIEHLEKARALDEANLETHIALARAYASSNHPDEARRERQLCLKLTDDHAPVP